jgi:phosphonate transport system permease protein
VPERSRLPLGLLAAVALLVLAIWSLISLNLNATQLMSGWNNLVMFIQRSMPPDHSVAPMAARAMLETIQMAVLGTLLAVLAAFPLAVLASRNLVPGVAGRVARFLLASMRVLPSILWALIFVALVGPGPLAGVLALAFYTTGILGKLQFEAIEGLPRDPVDALAALGTSRLLVVRHVILPEAANHFLSHVLFVFEYNVRHGAVLGLVGAGGIGTLMMGYLTFFQLDKLMIVLLVVLVTVLLIDAGSHALRRRFTEGPSSLVPLSADA